MIVCTKKRKECMSHHDEASSVEVVSYCLSSCAKEKHNKEYQ